MTYEKDVRAQGFSRSSTSGEFFYFTRCFTKTGDCGIFNGGFEDQPDDFRPWVFTSELDDAGFASASLEDNGDGDDFSTHLEIILRGSEGYSATLSQDITTLGPDMASDYNLALRFAVKQISPNTFYILRVTYNGGDLVQMPLEFETGTVTLNTRFSPVESTRENTKKPPRLAISIHLGDYQEGTVPNVRLGLDAFKITR